MNILFKLLRFYNIFLNEQRKYNRKLKINISKRIISISLDSNKENKNQLETFSIAVCEEQYVPTWIISVCGSMNPFPIWSIT